MKYLPSTILSLLIIITTGQNALAADGLAFDLADIKLGIWGDAANLFDYLVTTIWSLAEVPVSIGHSFGLVYLATAILIVFGVYVLQVRREPGRSAGGFFQFCFPRHIWAHHSSRVDRRYFLVNNTVGATLMAPLFISTALVAYHAAGVLEAAFGVTGPQLEVTWLAAILMALAVALASDFGFYVGHNLFHRVDFLWEFHKVHHSAEVLTPVTDQRAHPVQQIVLRTFSGVCIGLVLGVFDYLFSYQLTPLNIAGINIFSMMLMATTSNLNHSHVWISFGPVFNRIFISPALHQIHHSIDKIHSNRNFGGSFAIWDTLFGTLYVPKQQETLVLGLGNGEEKDFGSVAQLYFSPFLAATKLIAQRLKRFGNRIAIFTGKEIYNESNI